jgi:hypothetical protein
MPVHKVKGGYQWGSKGKVYPNKAQAEMQGRAAHASGYGRGKKPAMAKKGKGRRGGKG